LANVVHESQRDLIGNFPSGDDPHSAGLWQICLTLAAKSAPVDRLGNPNDATALTRHDERRFYFVLP
jgi:hypothetical protein